MNVQFDEDNFGQTLRPGMQPVELKTPGESKMASWLVKVGLAKDASSANVIMTIGALLVFGISVYFFVFGFSAPAALGPERPTTTRPGLK